jgi:hypothetical protein
MTTALFAITRGLRPISWRSSPFFIRSSTSTSTVKHPTSPQSDEEQLRAAREWLANLDSKTIPRRIGAVSFSRSSGPGGQNVNNYRYLIYIIGSIPRQLSKSRSVPCCHLSHRSYILDCEPLAMPPNDRTPSSSSPTNRADSRIMWTPALKSSISSSR